MSRKLTTIDLALWAALPMAHTSKIEGRLTMILDKNRRRGLPRRAFILGVAFAAAAVVPLAMLRLSVKAQAVSQEAGPVQLLGVQDIDIHHTDHRWWNAVGSILRGEVDAGAPPRTVMPLFRSASDKNLRFAFRLPHSTKEDDTIFFPSGGYPIEAVTSPGGDRGNAWSMYLAFPGSHATTAISVGVAAGPWTERVECPKTAGKTYFQSPSGEVTFTLIPNPHQSPAAQATRDNAVLMVSDHFRSPCPVKANNPLDAALHDGEFYQRTIYALDSAGRIVTKLNVLPQTWPYASSKPEEHFAVKTEQIVTIPNALLKRVASFRLVGRPYHWTEFKDVALQPVKP